MKTYIINLEKSVDRKNHILKELSLYPSLDYSLIKGVDGHTITDDELYSVIDTDSSQSHFKNNVNRAEVGCALSHIKCYKTMLNSSEGYALVLEDDALLSTDFESLLPFLKRNLEISDPIIILLTPNFKYKKVISNIIDRYYMSEVVSGFTALGYMLNRAAAQILVDRLYPIHVVADNWTYIKTLGINIFGVYPHPVSWLSRDEMNSTICPINVPSVHKFGVLELSNLRIWLAKIKNLFVVCLERVCGIKSSKRIWWSSNRKIQGF